MGSPITVPGLIPVVNWVSLVTKLSNAGGIQGILGPWRPPGWNQQQLYAITVTEVTTESTSHTITSGNNIVQTSQPEDVNPNLRQTTQSVTYFFDAILRAEHVQDLVKTEHPIQSGAAIVDHAYMRPARVQLEIGVYDSMARYLAGQFTSNSSKSVSAYQTLLDIQAKRVPITLTTRLNQYTDMVIESIRAIENYQTRNALRATVVLSQIIIAQIASQTIPASDRPDQTDVTNEGTKQALAPDPTVQNSSNLVGFP